MNDTPADAQSVLSLLEPLREPTPVSWWPPAPAWWIVASVLVLLLALGLRALWRYHRRGAPLREARERLEILASATMDPAAKLAHLGALQRRLAMRISGRRAVASLSGRAWTHYLNGLPPTGQQYFDEHLLSAAYQPQVQAGDVGDAIDATRRWLRDLDRPQ